MAHDHRTLYEVLGITRNARVHEIERAYRRLRADLQQESAIPDPRRAAILQNAHDVLCDPARRESYDESLRRPARRSRWDASVRRKAAWGALAVALASIAGYAALRLRSGEPAPRDPREMAEAASLAVGRLQSVDVSGAVTALGLAFALQEGALATSCTGLSPASQLIVSFAHRKVAARVAGMSAARDVCRLSADGIGSWPLAVAATVPSPGALVYAPGVGADGRVTLPDGKVRRVRREAGTTTIEVAGAAATQPAGGPLLDAQGRVVGVGQGGGSYRPVPREWAPG